VGGSGGKEVRAEPLADAAKAGLVRLVAGNWNAAFLTELCLAKGTRVTCARGDVPIEDVRVGDRVWTRRGWKTVQVSELTQRDAPLTMIETGHGVLRGTASHPVFVVGKGFVPLCQVSPGEFVLHLCAGRPSLTRGWIGTATPTPRTTPCGITTAGGGTGRRHTSIASCTCEKSGTFRPGTTFITGTATPLTTARPTWNYSQRPNTIGCTPCPAHSSHTPAPSAASSFGHAPLAPPSTVRSSAATQPAPFTANYGLASASGATGCLLRSPTGVGVAVFLAGSTSRGLANLNESSTAPCAAASSVRSTSGPFAVRAAAVLSSGTLTERSDVYNLEVEGAHEYFANGILTHNCSFPRGQYKDQVDSASGAFTVSGRGDVAVY